MEWTVPLQKLEVAKVRIGNLSSYNKKLFSPLAYTDGQIVMPNLTILLPHMVVDSFDSKTGMLNLRIDAAWVINKLQALQTSLINTIGTNQTLWFGSACFDVQEIYKRFQPMIDSNLLHLYCPIIPPEKRNPAARTVKILKNKTWYHDMQPGLLASGQKVRVALQFQGLSFQSGFHDNFWTGRTRIQHRVLGILVKSADP